MNAWLERFLTEKGFDRTIGFTVEGPSGANHMTYEIVIDAIKSAPTYEKERIRDTLVALDFHNRDIGHYFRHLAQAIAI